MTTTLPASARPGVRLYCDSVDLLREHQAATIDTLTRAGAVEAIGMVRGITGDIGSHAIRLDAWRAFCDLCGEHDIGVTACAFPDVREDQTPCLDHMSELVEATRCGVEPDLEPRDTGERDVHDRPIIRHWTPGKAALWLRRFPEASLTTTRIEAEHIGRVDRLVRGQLEQLSSVDTLDDAIRRLSVLTEPARIQPVIGTFDQRGIVRTIAMQRRDLLRLHAQAILSGGIVAWCARSTSHEEAALLLEMGLSWWPPARAA